MRLLQFNDDGDVSLTEFFEDGIPEYAILSHRWEAGEVTFKDLTDGTSKGKAGYGKIQFCGQQARRDELEYFWVDTCCIDKSSSAELSEAINSMFRWYQKAARCYVYLSDVVIRKRKATDTSAECTWESDFRASKWFTRGWTLQELLAPRSVEFFSQEGERLGDKRTLEQQIHEITGIPATALQEEPLSQFDIDERFSWATSRQTTRREDKAYSLFGIFDVQMPLLYGEGEVKAFQRLREAIDKPLKDRPETPPNPSIVIPFSRDADFVEREILDQIRQKCAVSGSRTALVGLGGVGKSQLAIEYAYRTRDRSPQTWVFWVHASNATRLEESFRHIADCVKISGRKNPQADIFQLVHDRLCDEKRGKWALILDNVDDASFLVEARRTEREGQPSGIESAKSRSLMSYLPQCPHGSILITTRSEDEALSLVEQRNIITIEPMSSEDALKLFETKLVGNNDGSDNGDVAAELLVALELMPLAIVQAAAYISRRTPRYSVREYLQSFRESDRKRTSLLDYNGKQLRRDREAKNSIIVTWQISFDHIRKIRPSAADLLSLMSFFDRQGIPDILLQNRSEQITSRQDEKQCTNGDDSCVDNDTGDSDDEDSSASQSSMSDRFEEDISVLRNYSFISVNANGTTFEMHGLVQLAMRKWLEANGQMERWKHQSIKNLDAELPTGEYENWERCQALFPHAQSAAAQKPKGSDSLTGWASVLYKAAWYAIRIGKVVEAESMLIQAMKVRKKILGVEHSDTLEGMGIVGLAYRLNGRWDDAERLEVKVMETFKTKLGVDHPDTLTSMANLASTYRNQGRWDDAEKLFVQVMETFKTKLGVDHPSTLTSMANLATTLWNQGRWDDAEKLFVQVMETRKTKLGVDHPSTLTSMANLASTLWNQGRWDDAEKLSVQVMETRKTKLGVDHPDTLTSMNNLAFAWKGNGKEIEAIRLMEDCVRGRKRSLGINHPDFISSCTALDTWKAEQ
ncbi:related to kinesin light chain [Phialocephala subalpina]|uniref:Related to kinesin light chain n=1 Tax=Phialocephala subalpina TaxID=576137 RepID=A0A1L7WH27_9HELO|nr:related to kinesin light chain [Phialocephala subalpina]